MSLKIRHCLFVVALGLFAQPLLSPAFAAAVSERRAEELRIEGLLKAGEIGKALQVSERLHAHDLHNLLEKPSPETVEISEIQQNLLDKDILLLEYLLGETKSYLWAVTSTSLRVYELPSRSVIEPLALELRESLIQSHQPAFRARAELAANRVSAILLAPVADQLARKTSLALVLDGCLQGVPFAVLPDPKNLREPLLARHEIVELPSASILAELRRRSAARPAASKTLAIFADPIFSKFDPRIARGLHGTTAPLTSLEVSRGTDLLDLPPLPFSRREAEAIRALLPERETLLALDFKASRELAVSRELDGFRYIHFATHAIQDGRAPNRSGIVLSLFDRTGQPQDGFLSAEIIRSLNLSADMVVLSACQTGLSQDATADDLTSLSQAFLAAGANRVVASLWSVSDTATSRLMTLFYQGLLKERLSPSMALRRAQLQMMKEARWSPPFYWAGFVLQGDWK